MDTDNEQRMILISRYSNTFAVIVLGFCAIFMLNLLPYQIDDAFITYGYSKNFLDFGIYSFSQSQGDIPTEGFSSQIWFWLAVVWGGVFGSGYIHYFGVFAGVCSFVALFFLLCVAVSKNRITGVMIALVCLNPGFVHYATTGLETLLFALLVAIFALSIMRLLPPYAGMVSAVMAAWTRPEAPWLYVLLLISLLDKENRLSIKEWLMVAASLAFGLVTLALFRWQIFHEFLPNTYYAKEADYVAGFKYILSAFSQIWFCCIFLLAVVGAAIGEQRHRVFFLMGMSWLLVVIIEGGDWMYHLRFLMPAIFLFAGAISGIERYTRKDLKYPMLLILLLICVFVWSSVRVTRNEIKTVHNFLSMNHNEYVWLRQWLISKNVKSVALVDMGEIGYFSSLDIFDLGGLTDKIVANQPGKHLQKTIPIDYFLDRNIDVVVLRLNKKPDGRRLQRADFGSDSEFSLLSEKKFLQRYHPAFIMAPGYNRDPYYSSFIFVRRDFSGDENFVRDLPLKFESGNWFLYFRRV